MSSIILPYKISSLIIDRNGSVTVLNYPDSHTVHIERGGTVFVWPFGYRELCYQYMSVHHYNAEPSKSFRVGRVNPDTHLYYEEGEVEEEGGDVPPSLYRKLENEIIELNALLGLKQKYLQEADRGALPALEQSEREAVEEEIFSLGITLTRKENFFTAVSEGLSFAKLETGEGDKMDLDCDFVGSRGKKLRDKRRTKAFRRDRETARLNKSGFRFQVDEDEAEAYVAKKAAESGECNAGEI